MSHFVLGTPVRKGDDLYVGSKRMPQEVLPAFLITPLAMIKVMYLDGKWYTTNNVSGNFSVEIDTSTRCYCSAKGIVIVGKKARPVDINWTQPIDIGRQGFVTGKIFISDYYIRNMIKESNFNAVDI